MTKIGTLAELNVKPGDVVEFVDGYLGMCPQYKGKRMVCTADGVSIDGTIGFPRGNYHKFHIISRASDTPKLWRDMTTEEKGALLLAHHEGKGIEYFSRIDNVWGKTYAPDWRDNYAYRIKPEPKVETVTTHGTWCNKGKMPKTQYVYEITFNLIDGKPDWNTAKVVGK